MIKPENKMTVTEFARNGGFARAKKLSAERRKEIATKAMQAAKDSGIQLGRGYTKA